MSSRTSKLLMIQISSLITEVQKLRAKVARLQRRLKKQKKIARS